MYIDRCVLKNKFVPLIAVKLEIVASPVYGVRIRFRLKINNDLFSLLNATVDSAGISFCAKYTHLIDLISSAGRHRRTMLNIYRTGGTCRPIIIIFTKINHVWMLRGHRRWCVATDYGYLPVAVELGSFRVIIYRHG